MGRISAKKVIKKCNILQIFIDKSGKIIYFNAKTAIYCRFNAFQME